MLDPRALGLAATLDPRALGLDARPKSLSS